LTFLNVQDGLEDLNRSGWGVVLTVTFGF
jgi:hypothetical protein